MLKKIGAYEFANQTPEERIVEKWTSLNTSRQVNPPDARALPRRFHQLRIVGVLDSITTSAPTPE
jgi:hypothetical protein